MNIRLAILVYSPSPPSSFSSLMLNFLVIWLHISSLHLLLFASYLSLWQHKEMNYIPAKQQDSTPCFFFSPRSQRFNPTTDLSMKC